MHLELTNSVQRATIDDCDAARVSGMSWRLHSRGYVVSSVRGGGMIYLHRLLTGATSGVQVDHIDHDRLNNRRANLRLASAAQNNRNSAISRRNRTGFKGVSRKGGRGPFRAFIGDDGRRIFLGSFPDAASAARAYDQAAVAIYGDFASPNGAPVVSGVR